jgi:hypothetical protein
MELSSGIVLPIRTLEFTVELSSESLFGGGNLPWRLRLILVSVEENLPLRLRDHQVFYP